jgi:hypothetical protein
VSTQDDRLHDAITTHAASHALGREEERTAVVAWLRRRTEDLAEAAYLTPTGSDADRYRIESAMLKEAADAIERGEHVPADHERTK